MRLDVGPQRESMILAVLRHFAQVAIEHVHIDQKSGRVQVMNVHEDLDTLAEFCVALLR